MDRKFYLLQSIDYYMLQSNSNTYLFKYLHVSKFYVYCSISFHLLALKFRDTDLLLYLCCLLNNIFQTRLVSCCIRRWTDSSCHLSEGFDLFSAEFAIIKESAYVGTVLSQLPDRNVFIILRFVIALSPTRLYSYLKMAKHFFKILADT